MTSKLAKEKAANAGRTRKGSACCKYTVPVCVCVCVCVCVFYMYLI